MHKSLFAVLMFACLLITNPVSAKDPYYSSVEIEQEADHMNGNLFYVNCEDPMGITWCLTMYPQSCKVADSCGVVEPCEVTLALPWTSFRISWVEEGGAEASMTGMIQALDEEGEIEIICTGIVCYVVPV